MSQAWMPLVRDHLASSPWFIAGAILAVLAVILGFSCVRALVRLQPLPFLLRLAGAALLFALASATLIVGVGTAGYRALAREELAAVIEVSPVAPQRFSAQVQWPDGRMARFDLAGDELYVDAHILKWKPLANYFGLHTAYELDRIAGRYRTLADERARERTVHELGVRKPIDVFSLRQRYVALAPLVDAEYGSASFVAVNRPAVLELRVSTSGLLLRERPAR